jgi:hypothetical protein
MDPSVRPLLTYWIKEQKLAERAVEAAKADGEKWFRRAKLAMQADRPDMAIEAKQKALEARDAWQKARLRLDLVTTERELLSGDIGLDVEGFKAAERRRAHIASEFQKMGIDPGFAALEDAHEELEADDVLARLRDRMRADRNAQRGIPPLRDAGPTDPTEPPNTGDVGWSSMPPSLESPISTEPPASGGFEDIG